VSLKSIRYIAVSLLCAAIVLFSTFISSYGLASSGNFPSENHTSNAVPPLQVPVLSYPSIVPLNTHTFPSDDFPNTYDGLQSLINSLPTTGAEQTIHITVPLIDSGTLPVVIIGNRNVRLISTASGGTTLMHTGVVSGQGLRHFRIGATSGIAVDNRLTITDGITITRQPGLATVGGGVSVYSGATFNMEGGVISNNRTSVSHGGGGVSVLSARANFSGNARIENNSTPNHGGGLAIGGLSSPPASSHVTISGDVRIIGNTAAGGGGVSFGGTDAILEMTGGAIGGTGQGEANQATIGGGLRMTNASATATISGNARIAGNRATATTNTEGGGGIWLQGGSITMGGSAAIEYNTAIGTAGITNGGAGGGVAITTVAQQVSNFTMTGGTIRYNHAERGGGVQRGSSTNAHFTMHSGEIRDNTADLDGGGLYAQGEAYRPVLEAADYARITIGAGAVFSGNRAGNGAFRPPDTTAVDSRIQTTSSSVFDHPINNFDINFRYGHMEHLITFYWNYNREDSIYLQKAIMPGTPVPRPADPIRSGFDFQGWFLDPEGSLPYDFDLPIAADVSLYAKWAPSPSPEPLQRESYIIGTNEGLLRPTRIITRAEIATLFFRLTSDEMRSAYWTQAHPFSDVGIDDWFHNAVSTTTNMGLFHHIADETFAPRQAITRGELAVVLARFMEAAELADDTSADLFDDIADHWARGYINLAAAKGWMQGSDGLGGAFYPDQDITRAEVAGIINRIFGRLPESPADLLPGMLTWPDNTDTTSPYYLDMQSAANAYASEKKEDGIHERWLELLPPHNWAALERPDSTPKSIV